MTDADADADADAAGTPADPPAEAPAATEQQAAEEPVARLADEVGLEDAGRPRKTRQVGGPAPMAAPTGGLGPGDQSERNGHVLRHYRMGVSGTALALAWARQENAPDGATVVVDREVSPLGRLAKIWTTPPESTLSCAIIMRPPLSADGGDAAWLLAGVAVAEGVEEVSGRTIGTWWPDLVVDEHGEPVGSVKLDIQLGPGKVRSAVATIRLDLDRLGLGADGRDAVLDAMLAALDRHGATMADGPEAAAAAYDSRCALHGRRVKITMRPKGEARGVARRVDRLARLEIESSTGMVQKIAIDTLREIQAV